jgi:4-amino-4-deoxy-L-arabinose transferase-like glycosyltransferase
MRQGLRAWATKHGDWLFWSALVVFWFATLGERALIHPDEGRYAELSLGMLQSGDWVTPRLNGFLYFEKPALQYWMGAASFLVFGVNEFAARFWPALTGLLSVLAVGLTARRLWGDGTYAALALAGSVWTIANSHFLTLDMGVTFFLTVTLCGFLWANDATATARESRYAMWLTWAAMALATLSKGLIGVLIPGAVLVLYSLINWQWAYWRRLQWLPGIALFALIAAPWFIVVSARNPGFAQFFFIHEHFDRFLSTVHRRDEPWWFFIPFLLVGLLPWTTLLPRLLREGWARRPGTFQPQRLLLVWVVFVFVFFSKSNSKLPSYILPMFPALALLLGQTLARLRAAELRKHLLLPTLLWALLACAYPFVERFASESTPLAVVRHLAGYLTVGGVVFVGCALLAWRCLAREDERNVRNVRAALMLLVAANVWGVSLAAIGHDAFGQLKSSKAVVAQVGHRLPPGAPVFSVRSYEQTFPFYLRRPVILVDYVDEFAYGQAAEPGRAIATLDEFVARWQSAPQAMAMLDAATFDELRAQGVAMQAVYRDARRLVVVKP